MSQNSALFDAAFITHRLERTLDGVTAPEIHLFAYLGCLLALYKGRPVSDWGYSFTRTEWGTPFATALSEATTSLRVRGLIASDVERFRSTLAGRELIDTVSDLSEFTDRARYLDGACSSVLSMSAGDIRDALHAEPALHRASDARTPRNLLDDIAIERLYEHFAVLSHAVGVAVEDLMVPAAVWLSYLAEVRESELSQLAIGPSVGRVDGLEISSGDA